MSPPSGSLPISVSLSLSAPASLMPPAARQLRPQLKDEQLKRSLLLAGLLHVWLAVLVGTAPGDARQDEQAGGGRLTVRLQGAATAQPGGAPDSQADRGPVGDAPSRRFGGVVRREDEPAPPDQPGAAREGEWAPQPSSVKQLQDTPDSARPRAEPLQPLAPPRSEALHSELPTPPAEVDPRVTRQLDSAPPTPAQVQAARVEPLARPLERLQPVARPTLPAQSAERLDTQVSPARIEVPQRLERLSAPSPTELRALPPLEAPAPRVSTLQSPSQPSPLTQAVRPQALGTLSSTPATIAASPTLSLPERSTGRLSADSLRPADKVQAAALAPLAAEQGARAQDLPASPGLAPSEHAVAQLPAEAASSAARISAPQPLGRLTPSAAAQSSLQGLQPMSVPSEQAGSGAAAATPAGSAAASSATAKSAERTPGTAAQPQAGERSLTGNASAAAAPSAQVAPTPGKISLSGADPGQGPSALPQPGSPDAGAQRGRDVATAPSAPASAPRLNLDLPTSQRGPVASSRSRALLEIAPNPPELKTKLQKDMEKALREDCRKAYAENGLLALGAMALDALRAKGCKF